MSLNPSRRLKLAAGAALGLLAGAVMAQEHSYAPADIEAGMGLYQANCLGCHGDRGDAVDGADLSSGRFRRVSSDEDMIRLIRSGIPNTLMPPHDRLSVGELRVIVAFVRSLAAGGGLRVDDRAVAIGDPRRGQSLFFNEGDCDTCHGVEAGYGPRLAPNLAAVGAQRSPASLEDAIHSPNAEVRAGDRFYRVLDLHGHETVGRLLNQDTHSVQLMDGKENLVSFMKDELTEHGFTDSPMPSYQDVLSPAQIADLVAYLLTLKGESAQ